MALQFSPIKRIAADLPTAQRDYSDLMPQLPDSVQDFESQSHTVLQDVCHAFGSLLQSIPGAADLRPYDLSRKLSVTGSLAWQVHSVAHCDDPFAAPEYMPGNQGVNIFLKAAEKHGAHPDTIQSVREAVDSYATLIKSHAYNRADFEKIVSSLSHEGQKRTTLKQRKAAFDANTYVFGARAELQLKVDIVNVSSANPSNLDCVTIKGFHNLSGVRPSRSWLLTRTAWIEDTGSEHTGVSTERLDLDALRDPDDQSSILRKYCNPHDLIAVPKRHSDTTVDTEIFGHGLGKTGAISCFTGEIYRGDIARYQHGNETKCATGTWLYTPCKQLVFDWYQHKDIQLDLPSAIMHSAAEDMKIWPIPDDHRALLPLHEQVQLLRDGLDIADLDEMSDYTPMVRDTFEHMGWDPKDFLLYRLSIPYPPMPASVFIIFDLPPAP